MANQKQSTPASAAAIWGNLGTFTMFPTARRYLERGERPQVLQNVGLADGSPAALQGGSPRRPRWASS